MPPHPVRGAGALREGGADPFEHPAERCGTPAGVRICWVAIATLVRHRESNANPFGSAVPAAATGVNNNNLVGWVSRSRRFGGIAIPKSRNRFFMS